MNKKHILKVLSELKKFFSDDDNQVLFLDHLTERVKLDYPDETHKKNNDEFTLPNEFNDNIDGYALFADGACRGNPGPGAWGAMGQNSKGEVLFTASGIEILTTNNQMELEGAFQALQYLTQIDDFDIAKKVILFSDSRYVVDGVTKWIAGWEKRGWKKADGKVPENLEQWKKLNELNAKFKSLEYKWVKGHAGHPQNEYCDELANNALDESGF